MQGCAKAKKSKASKTLKKKMFVSLHAAKSATEPTHELKQKKKGVKTLDNKASPINVNESFDDKISDVTSEKSENQA